MSNVIPDGEIKKQIDIGDKRRVILIDRLAMHDLYGKLECARNIYLVDSFDVIVWQIRSKFDEEGIPFTGLFCEGDKIKAYRWDGGVYSVDLASGFAAPEILAR